MTGAAPRVLVNRDFDPFYHSFYIRGLREVVPRHHLAYSSDEFPKSFGHRLAMIVHGADRERVFVCHSDYSTLDPAVLDWCDLYAKINIDPAQPLPESAPAILPIGPSFGVRVYSLPGAAVRALTAYRPSDVDPREHFANYYRQWRYRLPEAAYAPGEADPDYTFFAASLWHEDVATNQARAAFIEAARSLPGVRFEGGFAPRPHPGDDPPGYEALTTPTRVPFRDYLEKTRRSFVVFNTPAVGGCLGWKLGEFLALGKAIVSTPLNRVLPAPLLHGEHVHYVEPTREAIRDAIARIHGDSAYRRRLERGAREYYQRYLRPSAVVRRILEAAGAAWLDSHEAVPAVARPSGVPSAMTRKEQWR